MAMKIYMGSDGNYYKAMATRKKSNKGTSTLKKITTKAKTLYKKGKGGMKWTTAIKRAAKLV